jgi:hypothetical protein
VCHECSQVVSRTVYYFHPVLTNFWICRPVLVKIPSLNFTKLRPVVVTLFRRDRQTDSLVVAFLRNRFGNAPEKKERSNYLARILTPIDLNYLHVCVCVCLRRGLGWKVEWVVDVLDIPLTSAWDKQPGILSGAISFSREVRNSKAWRGT